MAAIESDTEECIKYEPNNLSVIDSSKPIMWYPLSICLNQPMATNVACETCGHVPSPSSFVDTSDGNILCGTCFQLRNQSNSYLNNIVQYFTPKGNQNKKVQKIISNVAISCYNNYKNNNDDAVEHNDNTHINVEDTQREGNMDRCGWNGNICEFIDHNKVCGFKVLMCAACKQHECLRKRMDAHQQICSEIAVECMLKCDKFIKRKNMTHHINRECENQLLYCENGGCNNEIARKYYTNHVKNLCEHRVVDCLFKEMGCIYEMKAKDLDHHLSVYELKHMKLQVKTLQSTNDDLRSRVRSLETENQSLQSSNALLRNTCNCSCSECSNCKSKKCIIQ
eukprot:64501_1